MEKICHTAAENVFGLPPLWIIILFLLDVHAGIQTRSRDYPACRPCRNQAPEGHAVTIKGLALCWLCFVAARPTVPPRWGPTASGDGSVSGEGAVSSHGNSTQNPNHVANAWDGWFNTGHSMDEMFNQHLYSGDYDYTSWSQAWHNSWQAWPWPGSKGSTVRPPNAVQTEVQQRKAEEQEQQEWEKKVAEAIDTDVLAGLKMLLEGRGSGTAGESPSPPRPEPLQAVEYD